MKDVMLNLILARYMARVYGENESAAIRRAAKNLIKGTTGLNKSFLNALALSTTPEFKRVEAVKKLEIGLRLEGLL